MAHYFTAAEAHKFFADMYDNEDWNGFGYLGARKERLVRSLEDVAASDLAFLSVVSPKDYDEDMDLALVFRIANSKWGRWFAEDFYNGMRASAVDLLTQHLS